MSDIITTKKLNLNTEERAWEIIPELVIDCLSQYTTNSDLIQLSQICRNFRTQLRPIFLKTLILFKHPDKALKEYSELPTKREKYLAMIKHMEKYIANDRTVVKGILFRSELPLYFYQELFKILKDVEFVKLRESNNIKKLPILNELRNLKRISLPIDSSTDIQRDKDLYFSFLKKMETIEMHDFYGEVCANISTTLKSNITLTNLESLTLLNYRMISSFPINLPLLINVSFTEIFDSKTNDTEKLVEFFNINPQLKKLTIAIQLLNDETIKSIFNLNNLKYLIVDNPYNYNAVRGLNGVQNRSIEHLDFTYYYQIYDYKVFFICCINLKVVEIYNLYPSSITGAGFEVDRLVKLLIIYKSYITHNDFPLSLLRHFSIVSFDKTIAVRKFKKTLQGLDGWEFRDNYPDNSRYFSIVRQ